MSASAHRNGHVTEYDTTAVGGKVPTHLLSLLRHWTLVCWWLVAGDGPPQDRGCGLPALPPAHAPSRGLAAARGPRHRQVPLPLARALQTAAPAAARRPRRGTQEVVRGERRRQAVREGRRAAVQVSCDWSAAGILTSDWRRLDTDNTDSVSLPSSPMGSRKIGLGYLTPPSQVRYLHNIYTISIISTQYLQRKLGSCQSPARQSSLSKEPVTITCHLVWPEEGDTVSPVTGITRSASPGPFTSVLKSGSLGEEAVTKVGCGFWKYLRVYHENIFRVCTTRARSGAGSASRGWTPATAAAAAGASPRPRASRGACPLHPSATSSCSSTRSWHQVGQSANTQTEKSG